MLKFDMPKEYETFKLYKKLTKDDIEKMKKGYKSTSMSDKWNIYYENDKWYFCRSWTGFCVYIISLNEINNELEVIVNRNKKQYIETDIEIDKVLLEMIINSRLLEDYSNQKELEIKWFELNTKQQIREGKRKYMTDEEIKQDVMNYLGYN